MFSRTFFSVTLSLLLVPFAYAAETSTTFEDLPHKASSLGACVSEGYVYVYGGHTGKTHSYSNETTVGKFYRAKLTGGKWEELPSGPAVQGLALVAFKGKIYRIGGMQPRNKPGEKSDNHSLRSFAVYDPTLKNWQDLIDLPEGRSSHDAVVVGENLYVFGGWKMNGAGNDPTWHKTGLVLDLAKENGSAKWEVIEQPFARRALAVETLGGKVYVIGGLTSDKGSRTDTNIYDPRSGKWSEGPGLPKKATSMGVGFSPAACVQGGTLFVSTNDGSIHRLSKDGTRWESTAKQQLARFVPRLVAGNGTLLILGGNLSAIDVEKKLNERQVEVIVVK